MKDVAIITSIACTFIIRECRHRTADGDETLYLFIDGGYIVNVHNIFIYGSLHESLVHSRDIWFNSANRERERRARRGPDGAR